MKKLYIFWGDVKLNQSYQVCDKSRFKKVTDVDTSGFAKKSDLASLKSDVDEIDTNKLKTVPIDLSTLSTVVDNDAVKETVYNQSLTLMSLTLMDVLKTQHNTDKSCLKKRIDDTTKKYPEIKFLVKAVKKRTNIYIKLFFSYPILLDFSNLFQIFLSRIVRENFWSQLGPVYFKLQFFDIFCNFKAFL